jgi:hypothetical protein
MNRKNRFFSLLLGASMLSAPSLAPAAEDLPAPVTCDRACLYRVLDDYLAAWKAHDPSRIGWSARGPQKTMANCASAMALG